MKNWLMAAFISSLILTYAVPALADQYVRGHTRRDGTYVAPHWRSSPNDSYNALKKLWETTALLRRPESVTYDAKRDVLYVSNINGALSDKKGAGFLSSLSVEGDILELKWVTGLNAPKGLGIHDDKLYVADIDSLVEIETRSGRVLNRFEAPDAEFLDDVAIDRVGNVYISDKRTNTIYRLRHGTIEVWLQSSEVESPNGLYLEGDRLIVACWGVGTKSLETKTPGSIQIIHLKDMSIKSLVKGGPLGNLDGIEMDGQNNYYATDWMGGRLLYIEANGTVKALLQLEQGAADLEFIVDKGLLLIPMMKSNKIVAYKVR